MSLVFDELELLIRCWSNYGKLDVMSRRTGISRRKLMGHAWLGKRLSDEDCGKVIEKYLPWQISKTEADQSPEGEQA